MRLEKITQRPESRRKANLSLSFHTVEDDTSKIFTYRLNAMNKSTVNLKCQHSKLFNCPGKATLKLGQIKVVPIDPLADRPRLKFHSIYAVSPDASTDSRNIITNIENWGTLTCSNNHARPEKMISRKIQTQLKFMTVQMKMSSMWLIRYV